MAKPITGKHVFLAFLAFFGCIFVANTFLIHYALSSWNGVVIKDPYEKGLAYNKTLNVREAERELGWHIQTHWEKEAPQNGVFLVSVMGEDNQPLTNSNVSVTFKRPTTQGYDQTFELNATATGFSRPIAFPLPGQWDAYVTVQQGDKSLTSKQRLHIL